jgi:hypothetical protein
MTRAATSLMGPQRDSARQHLNFLFQLKRGGPFEPPLRLPTDIRATVRGPASDMPLSDREFAAMSAL